VNEIEYEELARRIGTVPVVDVRTAAEHSGEAGYPCDPRQGHIPGARHIPVDAILELSPDDMRELVGEPEGAELVVYCHSGGRSAVAATALRAAGYNARNYAGSWHEWSRMSPA
jgi:thiosulfate/3-mercaptopyruvate sulfurtransferase